MPHTNSRRIRTSSSKKTWRCYYDDETEAIVQGMFALDFDIFGYDKVVSRNSANLVQRTVEDTDEETKDAEGSGKFQQVGGRTPQMFKVR